MTDPSENWTPASSSDTDMSYFSNDSAYASSESTTQTGKGSLSSSPEGEDLQAGSANNLGIDQDSHVSYDVNHNLKSSLTALLNSEVVREDETIRVWAQTRLMEAERELRRQRRRKAVPIIHISQEGGD